MNLSKMMNFINAGFCLHFFTERALTSLLLASFSKTTF